jgi:hypothetical protein
MTFAKVIMHLDWYEVFEDKVLDLIQLVVAIEKYQNGMILKISFVGLNLEQSTKIDH